MDAFHSGSQRDLVCDEEMDDNEFGSPPRELQRSSATVGRKAPRAEWNQYAPQGSFSDDDENDDMVLEQPDLHVYFSQWEIPDKQVVLLCRSYASYLSAKGHAKAK